MNINRRTTLDNEMFPEQDVCSRLHKQICELTEMIQTFTRLSVSVTKVTKIKNECAMLLAARTGIVAASKMLQSSSRDDHIETLTYIFKILNKQMLIICKSVETLLDDAVVLTKAKRCTAAIATIEAAMAVCNTAVAEFVNMEF